MDRQTTLDVGKAIGELVAINWRDRNRGWTKFIRIKVKINTSKPLRRIVKLVGREGTEIICALKYERLPDFYYFCGLTRHTTKRCRNKVGGSELSALNL
ncbi:hypothetical protein PVK06_003210 [Gossypium arboreum]|uniref:Zinc knuckle CX2CX4HX4C domain-containing protein n=1 Tax=Gossypium arboreum TaxID=29729 RepID=A0ABR0R5S6_GOSAR|nr:hypothetical protein PVK06_003210 [Gossypium arboreum]